MPLGSLLKRLRPPPSTLTLVPAAEPEAPEAPPVSDAEAPVLPVQATPGYAGRAVTLDDLDGVMAEGRAAAAVSLEAFHSFVEGFWLNAPVPPDLHPHDPRYREHQLEVYRAVAAKPYSVENERHEFDLDTLAARPFPYNTGSGAQVGEQLLAIGHVLKAMNSRAGERILEMGPGWGNTTLPLARMGCEVVALDVEPKYAEIVRRGAEQVGVSIDFRLGGFLDVETWSETFDTVLFFESFHHCDDHLRLLDAVPRLLRPGGRLVLAGEPVDSRLPYPWGLNCSGIGVWSIRNHGWLELAFREEYLLETLRQRGWDVTAHYCAHTSAGNAYVCTRAEAAGT